MTLTREEILAMEPGKKLNIAVATNVFKWQLELRSGYVENNWITEKGLIGINQWNPSEDISAAWEVVAHLKSNNWEFIIASEDDKIDVTFYWDVHRMEGAIFGGTAPEAICKAALLAVLNL